MAATAAATALDVLERAIGLGIRIAAEIIWDQLGRN